MGLRLWAAAIRGVRRCPGRAWQGTGDGAGACWSRASAPGLWPAATLRTLRGHLTGLAAVGKAVGRLGQLLISEISQVRDGEILEGILGSDGHP